MKALSPVLRALPALLICLLLLGCRDQPGFITDARGRALILHGTNVSASSKSDPQRLPWVERADVLRLSRDWGFNLARYLILWDALEPEERWPPVFDEAYLDLVEERLDWFAEAGIHVVLDMHQDVYSRRFCCNGTPGPGIISGAPEWAVRAEPELLASFDRGPAVFWFFSYLTEAVEQSFDRFWDYEGEHGDLQDHYMAAWVHVAERFRDHPAVLGYDIMNEPFPGSLFSVLELLERSDEPESALCVPLFDPGVLDGIEQTGGGCSPIFDREFLGPFYQRVIDAIRGVDSRSWIFYEPRVGPPSGGTSSHIPLLHDPRRGPDRIAYFPHYYSLAVEIGGAYREDDDSLANWAEKRQREAAAQNAPLLIGEWGFGDGTANREKFMVETLAMADATTSGWAIWEYGLGGWSLLDFEGEENWRADHLVRPYPQRVAGRPLAYGFDPETRVFELSFARVRGVFGPTEIYAPKRRHYPEGFEVELDARGTWRWDSRREVLKVWTRRREAAQRVVIRPAAPRGAARRDERDSDAGWLRGLGTLGSSPLFRASSLIGSAVEGSETH